MQFNRIKNLLKRIKELPFQKKLFFTGLILLGAGLIMFGTFYFQIILLEIRYRLNPPEEDVNVVLPNEEKPANDKPTLEFVNNDFAIIVPRIDANSKVIADVDPFDANEYNKALETGIAHAKGTSYPGQMGNVFAFAHSAVNFYEAQNYNVHFYFLNRLEAGDVIYIAYNNEVYTYKVTDNILADPSETKYLTDFQPGKKTLTLMTCWPAGTNYKRVIIIAEQVEE